MRKLILTIFLLSALHGYTQEKKCIEYKVGEFEYTNPKYSEWKVSRTDSLQVEVNTKSGIEIHSSIEWKSDCKYTLVCEKVVNYDLKNLIGKVFNVEILEVLTDRYICVSKSNDNGLVLEMMKTNANQ